ncbi:hypothetical protein K474DRAFT_57796 [Panus rudis PR-1116 ss-1]|nr:hypothetical protein K474DRAFT_57796 [Panus rudis PR-1116 ss-1]
MRLSILTISIFLLTTTFAFPLEVPADTTNNNGGPTIQVSYVPQAQIASGFNHLEARGPDGRSRPPPQALQLQPQAQGSQPLGSPRLRASLVEQLRKPFAPTPKSQAIQGSNGYKLDPNTKQPIVAWDSVVGSYYTQENNGKVAWHPHTEALKRPQPVRDPQTREARTVYVTKEGMFPHPYYNQRQYADVSRVEWEPVAHVTAPESKTKYQRYFYPTH